MEKILTVMFFRNDSDSEPVREWLKDLRKPDKLIIGEDIKTVEYGWPLGMPLVRKLDSDLWEIRCNLTNKQIARILFTVRNGVMVLLHGFVKKTQKTPISDLKIAKDRRNLVLKKGR